MNIIDGKPVLDVAISSENMDALRAKAALFDVLAARIVSDDWHVTPGINRNEVVIYNHSRGERVHGATLAEAVEKAMEAEAK